MNRFHALALAASVLSAPVPVREYRIDTGHTDVAFSIGFLGHPVRGRFDAEARSRSLHVLMLRALARLHRRRRVTAVTQPEPSIHNAEAEAPPVAAPTVTEGTA